MTSRALQGDHLALRHLVPCRARPTAPERVRAGRRTIRVASTSARMSAPDVAAIAERNQGMRLLDAILDEMPLEQRAVFTLFELRRYGRRKPSPSFSRFRWARYTRAYVWPVNSFAGPWRASRRVHATRRWRLEVPDERPEALARGAQQRLDV